jgi:hypothetical protein
MNVAALSTAFLAVEVRPRTRKGDDVGKPAAARVAGGWPGRRPPVGRAAVTMLHAARRRREFPRETGSRAAPVGVSASLALLERGSRVAAGQLARHRGQRGTISARNDGGAGRRRGATTVHQLRDVGRWRRMILLQLRDVRRWRRMILLQLRDVRRWRRMILLQLRDVRRWRRMIRLQLRDVRRWRRMILLQLRDVRRWRRMIRLQLRDVRRWRRMIRLQLRDVRRRRRMILLQLRDVRRRRRMILLQLRMILLQLREVGRRRRVIRRRRAPAKGSFRED